MEYYVALEYYAAMEEEPFLRNKKHLSSYLISQEKKVKGTSFSSLGPLSVAPMMGNTDRHFRYLMRGITRHTLLYTEMISTSAILRGDSSRLLAFSPVEKPLVLQLGGANPKELAICARIAEDMGYDQVNLNVGCPSSRAVAGSFGASLMELPSLVAECYAKMQSCCTIPITIKHRLGIGLEMNVEEIYSKLVFFVGEVARAGCRHYIVHARSALLASLSPKKNRKIPPLRYDFVYKLVKEFPHLSFVLNGGIRELESAKRILIDFDLEKSIGNSDVACTKDTVFSTSPISSFNLGKRGRGRLGGVMIGRGAYENPYAFSLADSCFYSEKEVPSTRQQVLNFLEDYLEQWPKKEDRSRILRHALNFFTGIPGARFWRRYLTLANNKEEAPKIFLKKAKSQIPSAVLEKIPKANLHKDAANFLR